MRENMRGLWWMVGMVAGVPLGILFANSESVQWFAINAILPYSIILPSVWKLSGWFVDRKG